MLAVRKGNFGFGNGAVGGGGKEALAEMVGNVLKDYRLLVASHRRA